MAEDYVIPPGQEAVLGTMLGSDTALSGGCKLNTGDIEKTIVKATYACPGGDVVFELSHPSAAPRGALRTEKFALRIESGTPPPDLQNVLLARIREHETDFRWTAQLRPAVPSQPRTVPVLALVLVLLLMTAGFLWRRRRRASSG
jgi:hypothetical protein